MENNKTYTSDIIGFTEPGKFGGYRVSFKIEQLEELKKYANAKGYVNLDIRDAKSGKPMCTVFNPRAAAAQQSGGAPVQSAPKQPTLSADDLPF
jgi:hypothetical protein